MLDSLNISISKIYANSSHGNSEFIPQDSSSLNKTKFLFALNSRSSSGKIYSCLSEKILQSLYNNRTSTISMKELINQFSDYEGSHNKSSEALRKNNSKKNEQYKQSPKNRFLKYKAQSKELDAENPFENSKLSGHIMNIDLKKTIEGIKEINELIIEIKYGKQVQKVIKKSGEEESDKDETNYFEFQSINEDKNLEFILQIKNKSGDVINIGSREYTLEGIVTQKKYYFLIDIPEAFKEEKQNNKMGEIIIAEIKMDFLLFSSNYKNNGFQTRKEEPELKKTNIKMGWEGEYPKNNQNTVGGKMENSEFEKRLNKESLTDFNDRKIFRFSKACDYIVEFNKIKYETKIFKGFELIFNNILKVEPHRNIPTYNKDKKIQLNEEQKEMVNKNDKEDNNKENEKISQENSNEKFGENEKELQ